MQRKNLQMFFCKFASFFTNYTQNLRFFSNLHRFFQFFPAFFCCVMRQPTSQNTNVFPITYHILSIHSFISYAKHSLRLYSSLYSLRSFYLIVIALPSVANSHFYLSQNVSPRIMRTHFEVFKNNLVNVDSQNCEPTK